MFLCNTSNPCPGTSCQITNIGKIFCHPVGKNVSKNFCIENFQFVIMKNLFSNFNEGMVLFVDCSLGSTSNTFLSAEKILKKGCHFFAVSSNPITLYAPSDHTLCAIRAIRSHFVLQQIGGCHPS